MIALSYEALAPHYALCEQLCYGSLLQRARTAQLNTLQNPQHVLCLGDGNGRFLDALLQRFPHTHAHYLDTSPRMMHLAQQRMQKHHPQAHIDWQLGSLHDLAAPTARFDLISTHFVLDQWNPQQITHFLQKLHTHLAPRAQWLLSDYQYAAAKPRWNHWRTRLHLACLYRLFALTCHLPTQKLHNPIPLLQKQHWHITHKKEFAHHLLASYLLTHV